MMLDFSLSFVEKRTLFERDFWINRDDVIHPYCNGNKARKFAALLDESRYPVWLSYGGNQSNAMSALAYLAHFKGVRFKYVMPQMSSLAHRQEMDNLAYALKWGMEVYVLPTGTSVGDLESYALSLVDSQTLFIPQGGSVEYALSGMSALALELKQSIGGNPLLFYASGSGVGVIALQKALDSIFPQASLVAICCAGSKSELRQRAYSHNVGHLQILQSPFAFAKPKREIWEMREYLSQNDVRCDLIYDSPAFCVIKAHLEQFSQRQLVFIHSGGLVGDISQVKRYESLLHR